MDCCYADSAIGHMAAAGVPTLESTPGTYTLTATNPLQQRARWSGRDDQTLTAFTGELLTLIRAGKENGPEWLSLNDFYPSLRQRLIGLSQPRRRGHHPAAVLRADGSGQLRDLGAAKGAGGGVLPAHSAAVLPPGPAHPGQVGASTGRPSACAESRSRLS
jgi:hypothetical protein